MRLRKKRMYLRQTTVAYIYLSLYISIYIHKKAEESEVRADVNASATEADVFVTDNRGFYLYLSLAISLHIYIRRTLAERARGRECARR